ncbi:hypothetical protein B0H12DRAFT_1101556 [Mycena haematopus]|nr:hypothetical protein B0H12DRAFT_1101556 [Mycena haematopus]
MLLHRRDTRNLRLVALTLPLLLHTKKAADGAQNRLSPRLVRATHDPELLHRLPVCIKPAHRPAALTLVLGSARRARSSGRICGGATMWVRGVADVKKAGRIVASRWCSRRGAAGGRCS